MRDRQLAELIVREMQEHDIHQQIMFMTRIVAKLEPKAKEMLVAAFAAENETDFIELMKQIQIIPGGQDDIA